MNQELTGQTWMITGISSGIGYELAGQLLAGGCKVIGLLRDVKKARLLLEAYPDALTLYEVDMCNFSAVDRVVNTALKAAGTISVVVSNAGVSLRGFAEEVELEELQEVVNTNLIGAMVFIRASIPYLKKYKGTLVQISSVNGEVPAAQWSYYSASKHGINGYCEAVAKELEPYGVKVIIMEPGKVNTELWNKVADRRREYDGLRPQSVKSDIDVRKLAGKIVSICSWEQPPQYIAMGSRANKRIIAQLERKRDIHMAWRQLSKEVDTDFKMIQPIMKKPEMAGGRDILMWPLGRECKNLLKKYNWSEWEDNLIGFVDAAPEKKGKYCLGRKIFRHDEVQMHISACYVIITSTDYYEEIRKTLEKIGLTSDMDFCYWKKLVED